jgi:hypothetical protein
MVQFYGKKHPIAGEYAAYPVPLKGIQPISAAQAAEGYAALNDPANIKKLGYTEAAYPSAVCYYRPPFLEDIYKSIGDYIRPFLDYDIEETYYYARLYGTGDELKIHTDRACCFVSVSLCFGYDYSPMFPKGAAWSLGALDPAGQAIEFKLHPGEGMLYPGCSAPHWREMFLGSHCGQAFFHWVPKIPAVFEEFYGDPGGDPGKTA